MIFDHLGKAHRWTRAAIAMCVSGILWLGPLCHLDVRRALGSGDVKVGADNSAGIFTAWLILMFLYVKGRG